MVEIVPAIIAKDFEEVRRKISLVEPYVEWVQLDISDGIFTTMKTWNEPERLKEIETKLAMEVHLMVSQPENQIDRWIGSGVNPVRDFNRQQESQANENYISNGVKRILIHVESTEFLAAIVEKIKSAGLEAGVVLNLQSPTSLLDGLAIMPDISVVQLMGIQDIGYYGHPFDEKVLPKILSLREKFPQIKIAIDGGINKETAKKAAQIGADILVAGSAIFGSGDIKKSIEELKNI